MNFGDQKKAFAFDNSLFDAGLCDGSATPGVCNPKHVNFGLDSERVPNWNIKNSGIGMKWDFQLPHPSIRFALTDWWGIGQTPVFVEIAYGAWVIRGSGAILPQGSNFATIGRELLQAREHQQGLSWKLWAGWRRIADYCDQREAASIWQRV